MSDAEANRLVLPGDLLGTAEEFVPGRGTYEDHGKIYAALLGHRHVSPKERAIRVEAIHPIPHVEEGDEVYARVEEVKSAMVVVTVLSLANSRRGVPGDPEGTIHISKAKEEYTESLGSEFAPGDVVIAKVIQAQPTIKLSTATPSLGVISARCSVCHALLMMGRPELTCPRCGHLEHRKAAKGRSAHRIPGGPPDAPGSP